jgi:RNA binding exosome subunit
LKKSTLASVDIRFFAQATEDEDRLVKTVSERLRIPEEVFEKENLEGHFKNPIISFRAHITGADADRFAKGLAVLFDEIDRETVLRNIPSQMDEHGALYLRIDKQSLFTGKLKESQADTVRIRLKIRFKDEPLKMAETHLALLTAKP